MVGVRGFEPPASTSRKPCLWLTGSCSKDVTYEHANHNSYLGEDERKQEKRGLEQDWNRGECLAVEGPPRGGGTLNAGWSNTYAVPNRGLAGNDGGIPEVLKV